MRSEAGIALSILCAHVVPAILALRPIELVQTPVLGIPNAVLTNTAQPLSTADLAVRHQDEEACSRFLKQNLPARDRGRVDGGFLNRHIELALRARRAYAWVADVPFDVFLNDVLPYASLDEQREVWRNFLWQELSAPVRNCRNTLQAADVINQYIWGRWRIQLKEDQVPQVMSPSQVIASGQASSTSLSIFLVNALRSLAIPARLVGTMEWRAALGGSHIWVEVWHDGRWSFLDSGEYRPLNNTWFYPYPARLQVPGDSQHGIFAVSFQHEPDEVALPWAPGFHGIDVTPHYK